jgi:signal peptidase I
VSFTVDNPIVDTGQQSPAAPPAQPIPSKPRRSVLSAIQWITYVIVITIFVMTFVVQAFQIPSESMENTLLIGDYLLVNKMQYGPRGVWGEILPYEPVKRGDIIVFKWPVHPEEHFVKRVVGVPGDRIHLVNGHVMVNGERVREDYAIYKRSAHDSFRDEFPTRSIFSPLMTRSWWADIPLLLRNGDLLVPEDSYFVLGDNRNESLDSRYWGLVPRENIVGKPLFIYFSLSKPEIATLADGSTADNDRILRVANIVVHLPSLARWHRSFMFVK